VDAQPTPSKKSQILSLLKEGKSAREIAAIVNVSPAYIYTTKNRANTQGNLSLPPAKRGRPKGSKNKKPRAAKTIKHLQEIPQVSVRYVEIPVPQPFSHFSFLERLKILFFKKV
jgi:transposase